MSNFIDFKDNAPMQERSEQFNAYCKEVRKCKQLTDVEIDTLINKMRETTDSKEQLAIRDKIISANQRLLISTANHYANNGILDIMDLINEGYFGLREAIRTYQPGRGSRFSSYAVMWIRDAVAKLIYAANTVYRPCDKKTAAIYNKCYERLYMKNDGIVSDEELLEEINKCLNKHNQISSMEDVTPMKFASYVDPSSLFDGDDENTPPVMALYNELNPAYDRDVSYLATDKDDDKNDAKRLIELAIKQLKSSKDRELICDLYGIGRVESGYSVAAMKYGVSETSIRKREKRILRDLKSGLENFA